MKHFPTTYDFVRWANEQERDNCNTLAPVSFLTSSPVDPPRRFTAAMGFAGQWVIAPAHRWNLSVTGSFLEMTFFGS